MPIDNLNITGVSLNLKTALIEKINTKTKPLGSLGVLEDIALQIGLIQNTLNPGLKNPHIIVFASDHGIAQEEVSAYPAEVTPQMVLNFLKGGAAINVFCRQHGLKLSIVDAGVNFDFPDNPQLIQAKIARGTRNFLKEMAMTPQQCEDALDKGRAIISTVAQKNCNIVGFGEMGIGNTSSSSLISSIVCGIPLEECIGRGTGLNDAQLKNKFITLNKALSFHNVSKKRPLEILKTFGGFEIAMMAGAFLEAARNRMIILVDGFIATAAFVIAHALYPQIKDYAIFCHQSDEKGHQKALEYLKVKPILRLNLRLGEGTGAALAFPIVQSAVNFLNEMASFEQAGVSQSCDENAQRT